MKVSIVVPAYNEEKVLTRSLQEIQAAAQAFRERGWRIELIVCDNNSSDRTAELARAAGAHVVFEPINQIGRARNCGAAAATGDWLVFVDADSHPSFALLSDVADQIQAGRCLAGGCTVRLDERHPFGDLLVSFWNGISRFKKWAAGSFIFCETAAFRQIGGFNQELFASEELDLSERLKRVARQRRLKFRILHRHPIVTSARKMHLYSRREHLRFLFRAAWRPKQTIRRRDFLPTWYDGRR